MNMFKNKKVGDIICVNNILGEIYSINTTTKVILVAFGEIVKIFRI